MQQCMMTIQVTLGIFVLNTATRTLPYGVVLANGRLNGTAMYPFRTVLHIRWILVMLTAHS